MKGRILLKTTGTFLLRILIRLLCFAGGFCLIWGLGNLINRAMSENQQMVVWISIMSGLLLLGLGYVIYLVVDLVREFRSIKEDYESGENKD